MYIYRINKKQQSNAIQHNTTTTFIFPKKNELVRWDSYAHVHWLAIKDLKTHRHSSQGWASACLYFLMFVWACFCYYWVICGWLGYLTTCTSLASVLYTCNSMYTYMYMYYVCIYMYMYVWCPVLLCQIL